MCIHIIYTFHLKVTDSLSHYAFSVVLSDYKSHEMISKQME